MPGSDGLRSVQAGKVRGISAWASLARSSNVLLSSTGTGSDTRHAPSGPSRADHVELMLGGVGEHVGVEIDQVIDSCQGRERGGDRDRAAAG